jgi:spore photoproduct lyase
MGVQKVTRKSFKIRYSGRSSDFISPSFGFGCLFNCSYCYMKRHLPNGLKVATNIGDILTAINNHVTFTSVDKPNQTDDKYITYDISCNEDFALHNKYYDWERIFQFFKEHTLAKATLATKTIPYNFLKFNSNKKVRIRFSLMPQNLSNLLEPNTAPIIERIQAVDKFIEAGYEVHLNFSPVVVYTGWLSDYKELFEWVDIHISNKNKSEVKAEVIFLTHNKHKHIDNIKNRTKGETLLWNPKIQEGKISEYGGSNIRYKAQYKQHYIRDFKNLHDQIIGWNKIRYIF